VLAVADHLRWVASCGSHQFAVDYQQAVIVARDVLLDNDVVADLCGRRPGVLELGA
jgi:hypothetical protein